MSFNGSGTFVLNSGGLPYVTGTTISSTTANNLNTDLASGLSTCLTKDGQTTVTANLPMATFRHTNVGVASARTDYARASQVQDSSLVYIGSIAGTNTITGSLTPAITAYAAGQTYSFIPANTNTGATTININSAGAKSIFSSGAACLGGELVANVPTTIVYDGTQFHIISSFANSAFSTGDVKLTIKTVADASWVLMDDKTIGNAASSATGRANADTVALFTLLWNNTVDANCAVSGGRGANAAADYAANKTIALPKTLGRALACYGSGSGLTARAMAQILGEENHALTSAENGPHDHTPSYQNVTGLIGSASNGFGGGSSNASAINLTIGSSGSGTPHNTMQPTSFLNVMIKL